MPHPKVKISDNSGNTVDVTSNALDVNIAGGASIDIGDVDMFLDGGTAIVGNAGVVTPGTLRVTLADNDAHWGTVGTAADADGVAHGQLRHIANSMASVATQATLSNLFDVCNYQTGTLKTEDAAHSSGDLGTHVLAVRNDTLASLSGDDGDYSSLQVNADGALYVTGGGGGTEYTEDVATANPIVGTATLIERDDALSSVTPAEGDWIGLRGTAEGALWTQDFNSDTITTHLSEIEGAVETIEGAVSSGQMQVDVVAALPAGANAIGKLAANSGVDIGDVDITSIAAGDNNIGNVDIASSVTLSVNSHAVTNAGTFATQVDGDALTALEKIDDIQDVIGTDGSTGPSKCVSIGGTYSGLMQEIAVDASGNLQVDVLNSALIVTNTGTFAVQAGHDITGMVSDLDADVGTTAEKIHTASDVAIKRIDIQADRSNTGYIYVGDSGVAGDGTGGGIALAAGDFYSLDIDNTGDVYVAASVADEDVTYIYYT